MKRIRAHVVEIDAAHLTWAKSTFSGSGGSNCVEAAHVTKSVLIRCSRNRQSLLPISEFAWSALLDHLRRG